MEDEINSNENTKNYNQFAQKPPQISVAVVVLGEIGRSPRMQYHSLSLAEQLNCKVEIIGYGKKSECRKELQSHKNIEFHSISDDIPEIAKKHFILRAFYRLFVTFFRLFFALWSLSTPDYILVQNPPAIPSLLALRLFCLLRGSKLVIDWHNFGYTILSQSLSPKHPAVMFHQWYERILGRGASANFCVTQSMKNVLNSWGIRSQVLYDRPPKFFKPTEIEEQHQLFLKLRSHLTKLESFYEISNNIERTPFTEKNLKTNTVSKRNTSLALLISSTSWTPDENFDIILKALSKYEEKAIQEEKISTHKKLPQLVLIITGRGPLKSFYEEKIKSIEFSHSIIHTIWLEIEDYPKLLGSCDLGVSLHTSSSGLDLPMKVVDMFGCGLPVCAVNFSCLHELVTDGITGLVFNSSDELAEQLFDLFKNFPEECIQLYKLKKNVLKRDVEEGRWEENWIKVAKSVFK